MSVHERVRTGRSGRTPWTVTTRQSARPTAAVHRHGPEPTPSPPPLPYVLLSSQRRSTVAQSPRRPFVYGAWPQASRYAVKNIRIHGPAGFVIASIYGRKHIRNRIR